MNNHTTSDCRYFFYNKVTPIINSLTWVEDYLLIKWCNYYNDAVYEIWQSVNGGAWTYFADTPANATSYQFHCKQNANIQVRLRAKLNDFISPFSSDSAIFKTPFVFQYPADLVGLAFTINQLNIAPGFTIHIDWGDGSTNDLINNNAAYVHNYPNAERYWVTISGDTDSITFINFAFANLFGDIGVWILPSGITDFIFNGNAVIGDISDLTFPATLINYNINGIPLLGAFSVINTLPAGIRIFNISSVTINGVWNINIPVGAATIQMLCGNCNFDGVPRGNFRWVSVFNFWDSELHEAEIDSFLAYVDGYFVGAVVPLTNCTYDFSGAGNEPPSAAGLASIVSIQAKYVAAGFVATILHN